IGVLYQNDDMGRDYLAGLKSGLGDRAASMIVGEVSYEVTDPTVDSQVVKLKSMGVDVFFDASTPKFAAQAIKKLADLGWTPVHILDISASSISATLKPAGLDIAKGIISTQYGKEPSDPQWKDDPGVKA
ncbi:ABC transporter substrate-binding protein, partial [Bradyrhizobium ottawaense]|uniref:ABC transporter substrate-binding protein n=1 Tax=Bradyrhizobium ottawaense TaxID=931866 RepID=UPI0030C73180